MIVTQIGGYYQEPANLLNVNALGGDVDFTVFGPVLDASASDQARAITRELISTAELSNKFSEASPGAKPLLTIRTAIILTYLNDTGLQPFLLKGEPAGSGTHL